jgi:hypothetical protein
MARTNARRLRSQRYLADRLLDCGLQFGRLSFFSSAA